MYFIEQITILDYVSLISHWVVPVRMAYPPSHVFSVYGRHPLDMPLGCPGDAEKSHKILHQCILLVFSFMSVFWQKIRVALDTPMILLLQRT